MRRPNTTEVRTQKTEVRFEYTGLDLEHANGKEKAPLSMTISWPIKMLKMPTFGLRHSQKFHVAILCWKTGIDFVA